MLSAARGAPAATRKRRHRGARHHGRAAPATLKGTVVGSALPDSGEGVASVRAVDAKTGVVGGADFTGGKRDRWKLRLPPGAYALGAATVPFEGGKLVDRLLAFARARSGKTESLKLKLKRKGGNRRPSAARMRAPARVAEGFGDVDVNHPAIWVKEWEVQSQSPELGQLRKGMVDLLQSDLLAGFESTGCKAVIVEREHIDAVINEQRLQQLPGFDPDSRVPNGHLVRDNASITGTLTEAGGHVTLTATYTDRRTGRSKTVSVQGPAVDIFTLEQQLAEKLVEAICGNGLPDTYVGSFGGRSVISEMTITWSGAATYERVKPPDPQAQLCTGAGIACYNVVGGSVTWQVSTSPGAVFCTYQSASKTTSIPAGFGAFTVEITDSDTPGYGGGLTANDTTEGTVQCPPEDPGQVPFLLLDCCFATTPSTTPGMPWGAFAQQGGFILQGTRTLGGVTSSWNFSGE